MISIYLLLFSSVFLSSCGGYLPSPAENWSANPSEMYVWEPPDEEKLAAKRENQKHLDNLAGEIERLYLNHASLQGQQSRMVEIIGKKDAEIRKTDSEFSGQIEKQLQRNKKMQAELNESRKRLDVQNEIIKELSKIKPPVIFPTRDYNSAMKAFSKGKYTMSIKLFRKILSQNPPKFLEDNIHFGMGSSFYRLKKYKKAKFHFQKIIDEFQMGDKRFNSYAMLGIIHNQQGNKSRALYLLDEALKNNPPEKIKPLLNSLILNITNNEGYASNR